MSQGQGGLNFKSAITGSQVSGQPAIQPSVGLNLSAAPLVSLAGDIMATNQRKFEAMGNTLMRGGEIVANTMMRQSEMDQQKELAEQNLAAQRERQAFEQQQTNFEQELTMSKGELFRLQEAYMSNPMDLTKKQKYEEYLNSPQGRMAHGNFKAEERKLFSNNLEKVDGGVVDSMLADPSVNRSLEYFGAKGMADLYPGVLSRALTQTGTISLVDPLDPARTIESPLNPQLLEFFGSLPPRQQSLFLDKVSERSQSLLEQQSKKVDMETKQYNAETSRSQAITSRRQQMLGEQRLGLDVEKELNNQAMDLQKIKESNAKIGLIEAQINNLNDKPTKLTSLNIKNPAHREIVRSRTNEQFGKRGIPNPVDSWKGTMYSKLGIESNTVGGLTPDKQAMAKAIDDSVVPEMNNIMDESLQSGKSIGDVILNKVRGLTGERDLTRVAKDGGSLHLQDGKLDQVNVLRFLYNTYTQNPKQLEIYMQAQRINLGSGKV